MPEHLVCGHKVTRWSYNCRAPAFHLATDLYDTPPLSSFLFTKVKRQLLLKHFLKSLCVNFVLFAAVMAFIVLPMNNGRKKNKLRSKKKDKTDTKRWWRRSLTLQFASSQLCVQGDANIVLPFILKRQNTVRLRLYRIMCPQFEGWDSNMWNDTIDWTHTSIDLTETPLFFVCLCFSCLFFHFRRIKRMEDILKG